MLIGDRNSAGSAISFISKLITAWMTLCDLPPLIPSRLQVLAPRLPRIRLHLMCFPLTNCRDMNPHG